MGRWLRARERGVGELVGGPPLRMVGREVVEVGWWTLLLMVVS